MVHQVSRLVYQNVIGAIHETGSIEPGDCYASDVEHKSTMKYFYLGKSFVLEVSVIISPLNSHVFPIFECIVDHGFVVLRPMIFCSKQNLLMKSLRLFAALSGYAWRINSQVNYGHPT